MILTIKNELKKRKEDNRGAALVLVIVAVAFIGMLVAMILYMSYCNYLMKSNDRLSKDNFYSAEYALGVINAGIQQDVSESMATAYVETMKNSSGQTTYEMTHDFKESFITEIREKLHYKEVVDGVNVDDYNKWNVTHLKEMWDNNGVTLADTAGALGAYLEPSGGDGNNSFKVSENRNYLTLENLYIVYTDERGYVSIIDTDIRIKVPSIDFAQSSAKLTLEDFSIIANDALINGNDGADVPDGGITKGSDVQIIGNVFGGYEGIQNIGPRRTRFAAPDDATDDSYEFKLFAEALEATNSLENGSGVYVDNPYITYVNDINLQTARLDMNGEKVYVGDDMDIAGKGSTVTVSSETYCGYGNMNGDSEGSSSILINGADTTIDFSQVENLILSGHAYVGAKKYDADKDRLLHVTENADDRDDIDESDKISDSADYDRLDGDQETGVGAFEPNDDTIPRNSRNVLMGESVSVKANQLLYLIPGDCIGYKAGTDEQVITQNPMSYSDYKMLTETQVPKKDAAGQVVTGPAGDEMENVYEPVRLSVLWNKLGGIAYTSNYRAVYRRVNGSVMVYLYLDFGGDNTMANAFFDAYYNYDKDGLKEYIGSYVDKIDLGRNTDLTLAGNAFRYEDGELQLVNDSLDDAEKFTNMIGMSEDYSNTYESLMHTLSTNYMSMTDEQRSSEIFDSLVDEDKLREYSGKEFVNGDIAAVVSDSDVLYTSGSSDEIKLIVSSKDVYVQDDFTGLIIAGGHIYVCNGCSKIQYSPSEVLQAMRASYTPQGSDKPYYVYEIFGESGRQSYGVVEEEGTGKDIKLGDLITYENWKKE